MPASAAVPCGASSHRCQAKSIVRRGYPAPSSAINAAASPAVRSVAANRLGDRASEQLRVDPLEPDRMSLTVQRAGATRVERLPQQRRLRAGERVADLLALGAADGERSSPVEAGNGEDVLELVQAHQRALPGALRDARSNGSRR